MLRRTLFLLLIVPFLTANALAAGKSGVDPQVLSLPKGPGSLEGLGESFEPNLNTGTASYQVKIQVTPGINKFQPELTLTYDSGFGNGILGMGWNLNFPYVQRQTDKGLPRYVDTDPFMYGGQGELVPLGGGQYQLKIEGSFSKLIKNGDIWEAWTKSGVHHIFGTSAEARVSTPLGVYKWLLERSEDPNGNKITYAYFQDGGNAYLQEIRYGYVDSGTHLRSVLFEYEGRNDPVQDYRSRTLIFTGKRLKSISVLSEGVLVRKYILDYQESSGTAVSLLHRITQLGRDGESTLPSTTFTYSSLDSGKARTTKMANAPGVSLKSGEADLVDIDGDSLPDIFHTPVTGHEFYLNQGRGKLTDTALTPARSPGYRLSSQGVMMADMRSAGKSDLFIQESASFGYFKNSGKPWEKEEDWVSYEAQPPFSLKDPNARMLDVNNDGYIDVIFSGPTEFVAYLNQKDNPWQETVEAKNPGFFFSDAHVQFGDMNGDHLEDLVYLDPNGDIFYLPNRGYANFGTEVFMSGSPSLPDEKILNGTILLMDVNNDGLADLLQVDSNTITLFINRGDNSFASAQVITDTPGFDIELPALRQADMNSDGKRELLFSVGATTLAHARVEDRFQYVDFSEGNYPNLLNSIDNGLGRKIEIQYRSSTEYYLDAVQEGNPWNTKLPISVPLVSRRVVHDKNSGQKYVTDFTYRDGYYDGAEKEFRGFARVEKIEYGDPTAPALKTLYLYDVGRTEESRKGMVIQTVTMTKDGSVQDSSTIFQRVQNTLETRELATAVNGETVRFSFIQQTDTSVYERTGSAKQLRVFFDYDQYGNEIKKFNYGQVNGTNLGLGKDEILTTTEYLYLINEGQWMVDRPSRVIQTDLEGNFVSDTRNTYDDQGNLIAQEKSPDGSSWITTIQNAYDAYGNIIKMTDANGHWREIEYDSSFHTFPVAETIGELDLTMQAAYDAALGKIVSFTDFNGHVTGFGYDVFGRLIRIVKPGDTDALPTQSFEYQLKDPVSCILTRSREVSGKEGTYDSYAYFDGLGRPLQVRSEGEIPGRWVVSDAVTFNQRQQVKQKWLPYFAKTPRFRAPDKKQPYTSSSYDPIGRVVKEVNPDNSFRSTQYLPLQKKVWDEEDNRAKGPHAGTPHIFTYDGLERLVSVKERDGKKTYITQYGYDGQNNLVSILDDQKNLKTMVFDGLGRKISMKDPDKGQMHYAYDGVGNLIETVDSKGQTVTYSYDPANRILTEEFNGVRVRYHYDGDLPEDRPDLANTLGRLSYVEDEAGRVCFSYDARGNVGQKMRKVDSYEFVQGMAYDAMDRVTGLIYPDGFKVKYRYNDMKLLDSIPGYVKNINYSPAGQKTRFVYGNGMESTYTYDERQRLTGLKTMGGKQALQDLSYDYDRVSNITAITDHRSKPTPESQTRSFVYDDLYRLTKAVAPSMWTIHYAYDSIGNLVKQTADVGDPMVNLGTLAYGQGSAGPHAVAKAGEFKYTYDGNGNIRTKTGYEFSFDHKDRLTSVEQKPGGVRGKYRYSYDGNRVSKTVIAKGRKATTLYIDRYAEVRDGQLIEYVFAGDRRVARISKPFDPGKLIQSSDSAGLNGVVIGTGGAESAEETDASTAGTVTYFYVPDHLGSASMVTDKSGKPVEESTYYPYGMNRMRTGTFESAYRFTGNELDDESDFHYFGARYYDAMVGRFVSVDPLSGTFERLDKDTKTLLLLRSSFNHTYSYCENMPVNRVDHRGLWSEDVHMGGSDYGTIRWAVDEGFSADDAVIIGVGDVSVDYNPIVSPVNVALAQGFHFNILADIPGSKDSRDLLADVTLKMAVIEWKYGDHRKALFLLGMGLHATQDKSSHTANVTKRWYKGNAPSFYHEQGMGIDNFNRDKLNDEGNTRESKVHGDTGEYLRKFKKQTGSGSKGKNSHDEK